MGRLEAERLVAKLGRDLYLNDPLIHQIIDMVGFAGLSEDEALVGMVKALVKNRDDLLKQLLDAERSKAIVIACNCGNVPT